MGISITDILGGDLLKGISGIIGEFKASPEDKLKFQAMLEQNAELLAEKQLEYDARMMEAINATMQAEAKAEHWATWLWRPIVGFTFSLVVLNNYAFMPYFRNRGLQPIDIPAELWWAMLTILGAAAAGRSVEKGIAAWKSKSVTEE